MAEVLAAGLRGRLDESADIALRVGHTGARPARSAFAGATLVVVAGALGWWLARGRTTSGEPAARRRR